MHIYIYIFKIRPSHYIHIVTHRIYSVGTTQQYLKHF